MGWRRGAVAALAALVAGPATAQDVRLPVLVPLTGFVALEGTSQRNGVLLAASQLKDVALKPDVLDTQVTPEAAVTAWERVMGGVPSPAAGLGLGVPLMLAIGDEVSFATEDGVTEVRMTFSRTSRQGGG